eukprot:1159113-Pelagomonas_calceolata.AAC.5
MKLHTGWEGGACRGSTSPSIIKVLAPFDWSGVAGEVPAEAGGPDPPIVRSVGGQILQRLDDVRDGIPACQSHEFQPRRNQHFQE